MARRLVAGDEQERELCPHLDVGEPFSVDLGVEESGDEVVGRNDRGPPFGDEGIDVAGELGMRARQPFAALVAVQRRIRALHDVIRPLRPAVVIARVRAEQVRDHRGRDRSRVVGDEFRVAAREQAVEQVVTELAREGLDAPDAMLRDRRVDDPPGLPVPRLGNLTHELLLGRHHDAGLAKARLKRGHVLGCCEHVVVAGQKVRARGSLGQRTSPTKRGEGGERNAA